MSKSSGGDLTSACFSSIAPLAVLPLVRVLAEEPIHRPGLRMNFGQHAHLGPVARIAPIAVPTRGKLPNNDLRPGTSETNSACRDGATRMCVAAKDAQLADPKIRHDAGVNATDACQLVRVVRRRATHSKCSGISCRNRERI